ncbi:MAG: helix-turn-helix transcriptional regulator [Cyanobacteria bacterium P01_D01_bin.14]
MNAVYKNHLDFYQRGPYAPFLVAHRSAGRSPIHMIHAAQPAGDFSDPAHPHILLGLMLGADAPLTRNHGAGRVRHKFRHGDLDLIPPNAATEIVAEGNHEFIGFILPFNAFRSAVQEQAPAFKGDFGVLHTMPFRDTFIERLCLRLWQESVSGNPYGSLFADGALLTLASVLLGLSEQQNLPQQRAAGILPKHFLVRLNEYIDAHSDAKLALTELAALAHMPVASFSQAFKATTGQSPYQYVLKRRIARACELLAISSLPLAEVAAACGFYDQAHLTRIFKKQLGTTPGVYRQEIQA